MDEFIIGSLTHRVGWGDNDTEAFAVALSTTKGPLGQFIVNLWNGGRFLETGYAFLSQDL